jgi:DNA-binding transcriptional MerR regulator
MGMQDFFPIGKLCEFYNLEIGFFREMGEIGLIELDLFRGEEGVYREELYRVEKVIRIHRDLHVNLEGIDVVLHMLRKQEELEEELLRLTNKLRRYEH